MVVHTYPIPGTFRTVDARANNQFSTGSADFSTFPPFPKGISGRFLRSILPETRVLGRARRQTKREGTA